MTMKTTLLKSLLAALVMLFSFTPSSAYDFEVDGIYYKRGNNEVAVCCKDFLNNKDAYVGNIEIPSQGQSQVSSANLSNKFLKDL